MLYYGYFRSTDTSVDPRGQLYKVEIFTNLNGTDPYPYADMYTPTMPLDGTELTMTTNPFVVSYTGDSGNIYKPYKCSTATVSFILDKYNPDFFTSNSNRVMVALLKKNYDIEETNNRWYDTTTGEDLGVRKHTYENDFTSITKYKPSDLDRICYTVEWVGFATPNAYNQSYFLPNQPFQLECQDALSTLAYQPYEFDYTDNITDIRSLLIHIEKKLGVYKDVYITSNIRIPDAEDTTFLRRVIFNIYNLRDDVHNKDRVPNTLELVSELMKLLNLTIIPVGNSLYIIQYDAILGNNEYYYHYYLNADTYNYYFNVIDSTITNKGLRLIPSDLSLTKDSFRGSDTAISVGNIYNKFAVENSDNSISFIPELKEIKDVYYIITPAENGTSVGTTNYWIPSGITCAINERGLKTYGYSTVSPYAESQNFVLSRQAWYNGSSYQYGGAVYLRDTTIKGRSQQASASMINAKYGGDTFFFFNVHNNSLVNKPYLTYQSPKILMNYNKCLEITGDMTFFNHQFPVYAVASDTFDDNYDLSIDLSKCYVRSKISATFNGVRYWFNSTSLSSSSWTSSNWSTYESFCWLPYYKYEDGKSSVDGAKPFGTSFSFQKTGTNSNGIRIPLDVSFINGEDCIFDFKIEIFPTRGCGVNSSGSWQPAHSMILQNFDVKMYDNRLKSEWGYKFADSVFSTYENEDYVDNQITISNKYSTNEYTKINSWGYVDRVCGNDYFTIHGISNMVTGLYLQPEKHTLANLYNQYTKPTLQIRTTIHENLGVKPYSKLTWASQFPNKNFVVDTMSIDYENNSTSINIVDKVISNNVPEIDFDTYLKGDNGYGLIPNPLISASRDNTSFSSYTIDDNGNIIATLTSLILYNESMEDSAIYYYPTFNDGTKGYADYCGIKYSNSYINNDGELIIEKD